MKQIARAYDDNQGYSIYDDELKYSSVLADNYDDEYDDTYDDDDNKDIDTFGIDRKGLRYSKFLQSLTVDLLENIFDEISAFYIILLLYSVITATHCLLIKLCINTFLFKFNSFHLI